MSGCFVGLLPNPGAFFSRTYKAFIEQARYLEEKNYHPGSGQNARGAYSALQSEEMMGFDVIAFLIRMRQMLK